MENIDFNIEDIIYLCTHENKEDSGMIIDDECLDDIIGELHQYKTVGKIIEEKIIGSVDLEDPVQVLHSFINLKKENIFYKRRIEFLNNLLKTKREELSISVFTKTDFVQHLAHKDEIFRTALKLNLDNTIQILYPLAENNGDKFKTEKRIKKRLNNKSNRSGNN